MVGVKLSDVSPINSQRKSPEKNSDETLQNKNLSQNFEHDEVASNVNVDDANARCLMNIAADIFFL